MDQWHNNPIGIKGIKKLHDTEPIISIGTLAEKLGLSVSSIRKYEAEGLIIPHRTPSGHRMFSYEDIDRVSLIQHMIQNLGLNIEGIRRLLAFVPCWEIFPCTANKSTCPAFNDVTKPCWMITGLECSNGKMEKCRVCDVYRFCSLHPEDVKKIAFSANEDSKHEIKEMINNWKKKGES